MVYEKDGITASIDRSADIVIVRDFEIDEVLIMTFGEAQYLPALSDFIEHIESGNAKEIRIEVSRSGYRMLLARFGYDLDNDMMVKRVSDDTPAQKEKLASATLENMSGSVFTADARIKMADGHEVPVSELEVGSEIAVGGIVTSILRGRQRSFVDIGRIRCGLSSAVFHDGHWLRAREHPKAQPLWFDDGIEGYTIGTANHQLIVNGELFADFYETAGRQKELADLSDQAIALMNADQDDDARE